MLEEGQLFERHLNKAHVFVFVIKDTLFDVLEDEWVFADDLFEIVLFKTTNCAVFVSDNRGGGQAVID